MKCGGQSQLLSIGNPIHPRKDGFPSRSIGPSRLQCFPPDSHATVIRNSRFSGERTLGVTSPSGSSPVGSNAHLPTLLEPDEAVAGAAADAVCAWGRCCDPPLVAGVSLPCCCSLCQHLAGFPEAPFAPRAWDGPESPREPCFVVESVDLWLATRPAGEVVSAAAEADAKISYPRLQACP